MTNSIVTVNVTQTVAPTPETLQASGALVSQGATTLAAGAISLLTQASDLTAILRGSAALTTITWSGNVATATAAAPHGYTNGDVLKITIAGASPAGYRGTFDCTVINSTQFTYALTPNPGGITVAGTYTLEDVAELLAMVTTFFAQGSSTSVTVLELGAGTPAEGVTALTDYITANPNSNYEPGATGFFYSYLVPRTWSGEATFLTMLASFEALTAKTYFFVTATTGNYTSFSNLMKCAVVLVEAPTIPVTEFSLAALFWVTLHYAPSSTNLITPTAFSFLIGVTAYPTRGNATLLAALKAAFTNYVATGAEGGISNTIAKWGVTRDGKDFTYWYSVDWVQLNSDLDLANAVINGSNNPLAPLYYNQAGINVLQAVAKRMITNAISYGLVLGQVVTTQLKAADFIANVQAGNYAGQAVINAEPFTVYSAENPNDYAIGQYTGITLVYTPSRGFVAIVFNVHVSNFVTP